MSSEQNSENGKGLISQYFKPCSKTIKNESKQKTIDSSRAIASVNNSRAKPVKRQQKPKKVETKFNKSKSDIVYLNIISNRENAAPVSSPVAGSECPATSDPPIEADLSDSEREAKLKVKYLEIQKKKKKIH